MKPSFVFRWLAAAAILCHCFSPAATFAQNGLPKDFEKKAREAFDKLPRREIEFSDYLRTEKDIFFQKRDIQKAALGIYAPKPSASACGNGDFESGTLDPNEWSAGYGFIDYFGDPIWTSMADGITNGRHTIVSTGTDPYSTVAQTHGGAKALRIGNSSVGRGCDVVSKTFVVSAGTSTIRFWYAVVLEDPGAGHANHERPSFWVKVLNGSGSQLTGLVNLGNPVQQDKIWADPSNLFLKKRTQGSHLINYTDWLCAEIDLSGQIGNLVTIQFITEDCSQGAHFGYAYIDDYCGSCGLGGPQGGIAYLADGSDCKTGKLCFSYSLPSAGGQTGSVQIQLQIFQNGSTIPVATLNSPVLTSGNQYCFSFEPCKIPGMDASLGGFDYVATGNFVLGGTTLPPKTSGSKPEGHVAGRNNDCVCDKYCCPGENLVKNPDFEKGNQDFTSQYNHNSAMTANATLPGQYNIVTGAEASGICSNWAAQDPSTCSNASGKFLVVNGSNCGPGKKLVWEQTVAVKDWTSYKFCMKAKNLKQCCFDILPKIEVKFLTLVPGINPIVQTINAPTGACNWVDVKQNIDLWGYGNSIKIQIWLDESLPGDGNDLALDNIALIELPRCPSPVFQVATSALNATDYSIQATFTLTASCPATWWEVCELDLTSGGCVAGTVVTNPSTWWFPNTNFPGYPSSIGSTSPGAFQYGKIYKITLGTWGECSGWSAFIRYVGSSKATRKIKVVTEDEYKKNPKALLDALK